MKRPYTKPEISELGSLEELTEQTFNKIGGSVDTFSNQQNQLVGSVVPFP